MMTAIYDYDIVRECSELQIAVASFLLAIKRACGDKFSLFDSKVKELCQNNTLLLGEGVWRRIEENVNKFSAKFKGMSNVSKFTHPEI
jgi:hypothetical protein